jgi:hypothetical protein
VLAGPRGRGVNVWVDVENLLPGSLVWDSEIERDIRGWSGYFAVARSESLRVGAAEFSFAEQNEKCSFPVLIHSDENDLIPCGFPTTSVWTCAGRWIALTAYTDVTNKDESSCEIYILRVDGSESRRLTTNHYCDYQPRRGK